MTSWVTEWVVEGLKSLVEGFESSNEYTELGHSISYKTAACLVKTQIRLHGCAGCSVFADILWIKGAKTWLTEVYPITLRGNGIHVPSGEATLSVDSV